MGLNKLDDARENGIALIEILVVVVLIGLLMIFSYFIVSLQIKKANDGVRKADLEKIKTALNDYYFDNSCFPAATPECGEQFPQSDGSYLSSFPCDPNGKSYGYQAQESDCPQWFKALANLDVKNDPGISKVKCHFGCGRDCNYNYGLSSTNIEVSAGCITFYVCSPAGRCEAFDNPRISQCPVVFENDPSCGEMCLDRVNRCHDARGKRTPDDDF